MTADHISRYRVVPCRRGFRIEAVTQDAVEVVTTCADEAEAVAQFRLLQLSVEHRELELLAIAEAPKTRGPRGCAMNGAG